ncbi:hypothetical protein MRB53_041394 [Persea americana]|nr:hypothetical protein MRB53_041394 [Persea americana]
MALPLIPLTPWRRVQEGMGNIIRTFNSPDGSSIDLPASQELETAVLRVFLGPRFGTASCLWLGHCHSKALVDRDPHLLQWAVLGAGGFRIVTGVVSQLVLCEPARERRDIASGCKARDHKATGSDSTLPGQIPPRATTLRLLVMPLWTPSLQFGVIVSTVDDLLTDSNHEKSSDGALVHSYDNAFGALSEVGMDVSIADDESTLMATKIALPHSRFVQPLKVRNFAPPQGSLLISSRRAFAICALKARHRRWQSTARYLDG